MNIEFLEEQENLKIDSEKIMQANEEQKVIEAIKVIKEYCVNQKTCSKCICDNGWCAFEGLHNEWVIEE